MVALLGRDNVMRRTEWIAVDWGTSTLRAWTIDHNGQVFQKLQSSSGVSVLKPNEFETTLLELIAPFLDHDAVTPVLCCGMVGARQGWEEAKYSMVPCQTGGIQDAHRVLTMDKRLEVVILPGFAQSLPADVMRGEETQIAGYLKWEPNFFGTICLPGTHTKWAQISANEVVSFRTFLTGEMFELLTKHSTLRFSLTTDAWDQAAFLDAVNDALSAPHYFSSRLFEIRSDALLNEIHAETARARLSGFVIGLELAGARAYWLGQDIALIGSSSLCSLYQTALEQQGVNSETHDGDDMVLEGLKAAYRSLILASS